MGTMDPALRRRRLTRSYELTSSAWMNVLGYAQSREGRWDKFRRLVEYQFLDHYFGDPPKWRLLLRRFGGERTLPDLAVVGPIKSGTSDLAVSMMMHPNVMVPLSKELISHYPKHWLPFFPTKRQKEAHCRRNGLALAPLIAPHLHWMELPYTLSRVRPGLKIVIVLREPAMRLHSQWKWEVFLSGRTQSQKLPFLKSFAAYVELALLLFPEFPMYSACGYQPLQQSIYWKAVRFWKDCFGPENVMVCDVGQYFQDRRQLLARVERFVGLPANPIACDGEIVNGNPVSLPIADQCSLSQLREFFRPHNERLWQEIGTTFDW